MGKGKTVVESGGSGSLGEQGRHCVSLWRKDILTMQVIVKGNMSKGKSHTIGSEQGSKENAGCSD